MADEERWSEQNPVSDLQDGDQSSLFRGAFNYRWSFLQLRQFLANYFASIDHITDSSAHGGHFEDTDNPHQTTAAQVGADPTGTASNAVGAHETTYTHDNLPTSNQKAALDATPTTPNAGNPYATQADIAVSGEANTSTTPAAVGSNEADINMAKVNQDLQKRKISGTTTVGITQTADAIQFTVQPGSITQTYLSATYALEARTVTGVNSVSGGGDLSANRTLALVNDAANPGPNQVYGTDGAGTKGWKADPAGGGGGMQIGTPFVNGELAVVEDQNSPGTLQTSGLVASQVPQLDADQSFTGDQEFSGALTKNTEEVIAERDVINAGVASQITVIDSDTLPGNTWSPNPLTETQCFQIVGSTNFTVSSGSMPNTQVWGSVPAAVAQVSFIGFVQINPRPARDAILYLSRAGAIYHATWS